MKLAGNVGHQYALTAGLITAKDMSDVTVSIDADLQDDINVIPEMLDKYSIGVGKCKKPSFSYPKSIKTLLWNNYLLLF